MPDPMFNAYSPYLAGIDGTALIFAARTLREVREALDRGAGFRTDTASRSLGNALVEADRIREILKQREAA